MPEPAAWQLTRSDSTAALQAPGNVGLYSYVPSAANAYPVKVSFTDITVTDPSGTPPPVNQVPVAGLHVERAEPGGVGGRIVEYGCGWHGGVVCVGVRRRWDGDWRQSRRTRTRLRARTR